MTWKEIKNIINNMDGSELESEAKFLKNGNTLVTISLEKLLKNITQIQNGDNIRYLNLI